ncbi:MAG: hypothetical protein P1Q69_14235, partial [Candidatus Thorarchaeota archaeon]|nr:hypothetical protein [Candidatus Thorarchaeota archaeon]
MSGANLVDAYTSSEELSAFQQRKDRDAPSLLHDLGTLHDLIFEEVEDELRQQYILGEIDSFWTVVRWLSGEPMLYSEIVEGIFNIPMRGFHPREVSRRTDELADMMSKYPGETVNEKVALFHTEGMVSGADLQSLISEDLQSRSSDVGEMFKKHVYSYIGNEVNDNGVEYRCVNNKPWSGYNWYQKGFKSLNEFNIDRPFNRDTLHSVIYHEYEHHVSNLWREQAFRETGNLELSVVPMHTGRCVISEGTADTAKDFLGVVDDDERTRISNSIYIINRMTAINAAIMLNAEKNTMDEAVDYLMSDGLRTETAARGGLAFIQPKQTDGRPNFYAPYVFTYYFGR